MTTTDITVSGRGCGSVAAVREGVVNVMVHSWGMRWGGGWMAEEAGEQRSSLITFPIEKSITKLNWTNPILRKLEWAYQRLSEGMDDSRAYLVGHLR